MKGFDPQFPDKLIEEEPTQRDWFRLFQMAFFGDEDIQRGILRELSDLNQGLSLATEKLGDIEDSIDAGVEKK